MAGQQTPTRSEFTNVAEHTGIDFLCRAAQKAGKCPMGRIVDGSATSDADRDGQLDLLFANGAR